MKTKIWIIALVAALFGTVNNTNAQDDNNRDARRQEMRARQTERLIKDLKLTDEQKGKFEPAYANYLKEIAATRQENNRDNQAEQTKKDLTDAEATSQLNDIFMRQATQIQQSQLRLDIQKKYCAEFSAYLTPQQLLRVFQPQQNPMRQGNGDRQRGRGGFGGGGGPRGGFGGGGGFGGSRGDF